jgi:hypothetical protein
MSTYGQPIMDQWQANRNGRQGCQGEVGPFCPIRTPRLHLDCVTCNENQTGDSAATVLGDRPPRVEKILDVKRQLGEGRYDIGDRLDIVMDRLLEDLL